MTAGAAVAAAGYAVARLLVTVPDEGMFDRLADASGRRSWPVRNPASLGALAIVAEPFDPHVARTEWSRVLGGGAGAVEQLESARVPGPSPVVDLEQAYQRIGLRRNHVGGVPADHLALEVMALAHCLALLGRAEQRQAAPALTWPASPASPEALSDVARSLLWDHLDHFAVDVLTEIDDRARTPPLRALPGLALGFLDEATDFVAVPAAG